MPDEHEQFIEALGLVHELADQNKLSPKEADSPELVAESARQQAALDLVAGYIENNG